jgi:hypothetical protein
MSSSSNLSPPNLAKRLLIDFSYLAFECGSCYRLSAIAHYWLALLDDLDPAYKETNFSTCHICFTTIG